MTINSTKSETRDSVDLTTPSAVSQAAQQDYKDLFAGKTILVTGGTGSIGACIVRSLLPFQPQVIRVLSRDESKQFAMQHQLGQQSCLRYLVGDVRDKERLRLAMRDVDIVFHAAALKHVPSCEYNPFEAIKTNVIGLQNLIELTLHSPVEKLVAISTDKATSPSNVMGATKLLGERLIAAGHCHREDKGPVMSCVRFGNVIGSVGSVIPLFLDQLRRNQPLTLTHPDMTRFMMSIPEAIDLIFRAARWAAGGEVFIFKMPAVQIKTLQEAVVELFAEQNDQDASQFTTSIIGIRPGEKMYEELLTLEESEMAIELEDMFVLSSRLDRIQHVLQGRPCAVGRYTSNDVPLLDKQQIKALLLNSGVMQSKTSSSFKPIYRSYVS